jgi:integrase
MPLTCSMRCRQPVCSLIGRGWHGAPAPSKGGPGASRPRRAAGGEAAGLGDPLTANRLRATHIALSHRSGDSLEEIRTRVGHRHVRTTARFLPD